MDKTDYEAQQARLAEYRKQQEHTKQPERSTSSSKEIDPQGQPFKDQAPLKPDFHKAHDHVSKARDQKRQQHREQDSARMSPGGMNGPTPPQGIRKSPDRQALHEELKRTHEQAKIRQQQQNYGKINDGKNHDRSR